MTKDAVEGDGENRDELESAGADFVDFLSDAKPPLFVSDSLTYLLRTEPPIHVEVSAVVDIVEAWAVKHSAESGQSLADLFLGTLKRIVEAFQANTIRDFDPMEFFQSFALRLAARCPEDERERFRAGLRSLMAALPSAAPPRAKPSSDGMTVEVRGEMVPVKVAQERAIGRIEHGAYMSDADFEAAFADLQAALSSRLGFSVTTALKRVSVAAASIFNTGRYDQARRLFDFVDESFERLLISEEGRIDVRSAVGPPQLNEAMLAKLFNDTAHRDVAAVIARGVGYLNADDALGALAGEKRRERRRLLLNVLEAHGTSAFPHVLRQLTASDVAAQPWYWIRNLLFLLSRVAAPDDVSRHKALEAVGRYVANDQPQLRASALAALKQLGGRETIPHLVKALDPASYPAGSIDDTEPLGRHLFQVMEQLLESGSETAITIVADVATGVRGSDFDLGQTLRDEACAVLTQRKTPLPRRAALAIVNQLRQMLNKRLKIVTGVLSLGIDVRACRTLAALLTDSPEPEAREILAHPTLAKVLGR